MGAVSLLLLCNTARFQPDILSWPPELESNLYKQIPENKNINLAYCMEESGPSQYTIISTLSLLYTKKERKAE